MKRMQRVAESREKKGKERKVFGRLPRVAAALGAGLALGLFSMQVVLADSDCKTKEIPEYVDINVQAACPKLEGLKKDKKKVLHFTHKAHVEMLAKKGDKFVCATCHKSAATEKDIIGVDKCERLQKELEKDGGAAKLKKHFHNICLKCHKDLKKAGEQTGPTNCKGCHNRKGDK